MARKIITLPEMMAIYCRCRDVDVVGTVSMWEKIVPGKDCRCYLKPLKGKVRDVKTQDITMSEVGDTWEAYIPPEILFRDNNENK